MTIAVPIQAIELASGSKIAIHNLSWRDFKTIIQDLGEKRHTRVAYYQGTLEIMSPLALHERLHRTIAYMITTILEIQGRSWENFGSTTFKLQIITNYKLGDSPRLHNFPQVLT